MNDEIIRSFIYISGSPKFSKKASELLTDYIYILYAASTRPIHLGMCLNLLYSNIQEAKMAHFIEENKFNIIAQLFQHKFDVLCQKEYTYNGKYRENRIQDVSTKALLYFNKFAPSILESKYEATV